MPEIRVIDELGEQIDRLAAKEGETFAVAAMRKWPLGWPGKSVLIYDKERTPVTEEAAVHTPMQPGDEFTVVVLPQFQTVILGVKLYMWIIAAVSLAASYMMAPKIPKVNEGSNYEWDDSTPQFFSAQSNSMNPGSRVPDIFGTIRVWPDLITQADVRYSAAGDSQTIRELYVVSQGAVGIGEVRFHDEDLTTLPASSFAVHYPGSTWPVDFPIMRSNTFVGGIDLPGPNEVEQTDVTLTLEYGIITASTSEFFAGFTVGQWFVLDGVSPQNQRPTYVGGISNDGTQIYLGIALPVPETLYGTVVFRPLSNLWWGGSDLVQYQYGAQQGATFTAMYNQRTSSQADEAEVVYDFIGNFTNLRMDHVLPFAQGTWISVRDPSLRATRSAGSQSGYTQSTGGGWFYTTKNGTMEQWDAWNEPCWWVQFAETDYNPDIPGDGHATAIYTVPGTVNEIVADIEFPTGLYYQKAGKDPKTHGVLLRMYYRKEGQAWAYTDRWFSSMTRTSRRYTWSVWVDPGDYEVYFARLSESLGETSDAIYVDACRIAALQGRQVTTDLSSDVLNCTILEVTLTTQNLTNVSQQRSLNCVATRYLPNHLEGRPWEYNPTGRIIDAVLYTLIDEAGYAMSNIDVQSLWAVQADLEAISWQSGQFNGIVDQTMTAEDQIMLFASVGRIQIYRRAGTFYFARLKAGLLPRALINGRNKLEPESKSMTFSERNDPDAIIVSYLNAADSWKESSVQWPTGITPINPEEQNLLGVTDPNVAQRIAQYVWDKRRYERDVTRVVMTDEGALLAPGDVIAVTDSLRETPPIDGEIIKTEGDILTFDQPIPIGTYMVRLRDKFGDIYWSGQVTFSFVGDVHQISGWGNVMPDAPAQVGLLYSCTPIGQDHLEEYYVRSVMPDTNGTVVVEGIAYRDAAYACDSSTNVRVAKARKKLQRRPIKS